jgi:hypothetical protein
MNAFEASSWAKEVAERLRMLQTSFASDSLQERQEYLAEEIERSLKDVVDSRRAEYLDALAGRFPKPEQVGDLLAGRTPLIESVEKTADELADELIDRLPELNKETKARLIERFRRIGLIDEAVPSLDPVDHSNCVRNSY